jgi:lipopolysaccharide/colanic/teichoic acid biosynthesis glycosyltransferase
MTNDNKLQYSTDDTTEKVEAPKKQQEEQTETTQQEEQKSGSRVRVRILPIWLRIVIVLLLLVIVIVIGVIFGYSVLGDGDASDALKWETWQHIIDIIRGVE